MWEKAFRPSHLLWLAVPLAIWWGAQAPPSGNSVSHGPEVPAPPVQPLPFSDAFAVIDRGLETADAAQLRERLQAALRLPPGMEHDHALELVCARWAEVDPKDGLDFLAKAPEPYDPAIRGMLLKEWALQDSDATWDYLASRPALGADEDIQMVSDGLLTEDPVLFVRWVWRTPRHIPPPDAVNPAWLTVARAKPEELQAIALKILETSPPVLNSPEIWNPTTGTLFTLLGSTRAEQDPRAAFTWADTLPDPYRAQAWKGALATLAKGSPRVALERFDELCSGKSPEWLRTTFSSEGGRDPVNGPNVLIALGSADPRIAADLVRRYPGLDGTASLRELFGKAVADGRIGAVSACRALAAADSGDGEVRARVLPRIWNSLTPEQLRTVATTLAQQPGLDGRNEAVGGILNAWFSQEPKAALAFATDLDQPELRRAFYQQLLQQSPPGDVPANLQRIPTSDRATAISALVAETDLWAGSGITQPRIEEVASLLADLPASPDLTDASMGVAGIWGRLDPKAALLWAGHLRDTELRAACVTEAVQSWAAYDSNAAAEWLDTQPAGRLRDAATLPLVTRLKESEPDVAWAWAGSISNDALRRQARRDAFASWAMVDPDAAAAALNETTGLSQDDFVVLRQTLPPS